MCEVEQAIKRLRNGKSPGIDNIQAELLKESDIEGIKIIHRLCNEDLEKQRLAGRLEKGSVSTFTKERRYKGVC